MSILLVELKEGRAGIAVEDISAMIPDVHASDTRTVIYTAVFTDGLSVEGHIDEMLGLWHWHVEGDEDDDET